MEPQISVIVPVFNGGKLLSQCLKAIKESSYKSFELIVVNDASTDNSSEIARQHVATVLSLPHRLGPAAARNLGAQKARGEILFFVDADVVVQSDSLAQVASAFALRPDVAAVFGSYDDAPAQQNFLSQYRNLYHHFVHQAANENAATFWAGCGAIRRWAFHAVNGFDAALYSRPCIEDIELGSRLRAAGQKILLDKALRCKHLKRWTFGSLLKTDIFDRAVPWSRLILERGELVNDLNLRIRDRVSTALVGLLVFTVFSSLLQPRVLIAVVAALLMIFLLNHRLFGFFFRLRGPGFVAGAFVMQLLHFFYSGLTFTCCGIQYCFGVKRLKHEVSTEMR